MFSEKKKLTDIQPGDVLRSSRGDYDIYILNKTSGPIPTVSFLEKKFNSFNVKEQISSLTLFLEKEYWPLGGWTKWKFLNILSVEKNYIGKITNKEQIISEIKETRDQLKLELDDAA